MRYRLGLSRAFDEGERARWAGKGVAVSLLYETGQVVTHKKQSARDRGEADKPPFILFPGVTGGKGQPCVTLAGRVQEDGECDFTFSVVTTSFMHRRCWFILEVTSPDLPVTGPMRVYIKARGVQEHGPGRRASLPASVRARRFADEGEVEGKGGGGGGGGLLEPGDAASVGSSPRCARSLSPLDSPRAPASASDLDAPGGAAGAAALALSSHLHSISFSVKRRRCSAPPENLIQVKIEGPSGPAHGGSLALTEPEAEAEAGRAGPGAASGALGLQRDRASSAPSSSSDIYGAGSGALAIGPGPLAMGGAGWPRPPPSHVLSHWPPHAQQQQQQQLAQGARLVPSPAAAQQLAPVRASAHAQQFGCAATLTPSSSWPWYPSEPSPVHDQGPGRLVMQLPVSVSASHDQGHSHGGWVPTSALGLRPRAFPAPPLASPPGAPAPCSDRDAQGAGSIPEGALSTFWGPAEEAYPAPAPGQGPAAAYFHVFPEGMYPQGGYPSGQSPW
eukprot:tig00000640_g2757.t1